MNIPNVDGATLEKVMQYCEYTVNSSDSTETKEAWNENFIKLEHDTLFAIILAANYLDIKSLLDLSCKKAANSIKGKTPEEIRRMWNIKNDFTPEEEEQIRKENEWCEEK